jgi:hypothetical protein
VPEDDTTRRRWRQEDDFVAGSSAGPARAHLRARDPRRACRRRLSHRVATGGCAPGDHRPSGQAEAAVLLIGDVRETNREAVSTRDRLHTSELIVG